MDVFIYGTGGHAAVIYDNIVSSNGYSVVCFVDDNSDKETYLGLPVHKTPEALKLTKTGVIAIGVNHIREKVVQELLAINANINFISAIHANAVVSERAIIKPGVVIMAGAVVNANATIDEHAVINTGAIVEHDCQISSYASIAPGAVLGGNVSIGERSFISMGTQLKQGIQIKNDTVIGMGSIVTSNFEDHVTAYGQPCKVVNNRKKEDSYLA